VASIVVPLPVRDLRGGHLVGGDLFLIPIEGAGMIVAVHPDNGTTPHRIYAQIGEITMT
jgi:hypothetical protein